MMYELPEKLKKMVPYRPLEGNYKIRLDANESFLSLPEELREEIAQAVSGVAFHRYPDPHCTALCKQFANFFGVSSEAVVAGNGSDELIGLIVSSFAGAGESMVVVEPDFSMYSFYAHLYDVKVNTFIKEAGALALDIDALIAFVKQINPRLVILSNPCNPTSLAASRTDILKLMEALDCLLVIDEAYMDFSEGSVLSLCEQYDNLIVLKTCSKAFGLAAIRLGFAVGAQPLIKAIKAVKSPYNVNTLTQEIGSILLSKRDYLHRCIAEIKSSRDLLYQEMLRLSQRFSTILEVSNTSANFVFIKMKNAADTAEFLSEQGIAVRCMEPFLRISAGSQQENQQLVQVLETILKEDSI